MSTEALTESTGGTQEPAAPAEVTTKAESSGADSKAPNPMVTSSGTTSAPVFTPNFKFKANQKEMEFDEFLRPAIKDADTEKKIRELYEKAHGLDTVRPERDELKTKFGELHGEHTQLQTGLSTLSHYVQKKDYTSFFQALNIPKKDIMEYALLQVELQNATPEQRAAYEQSRTEGQRLHTLEQQNRMLQEQFTQQSVGRRTMELDLALQKPDTSGTMQAFDARMGRIGAFRDEVIRRGQWYAQNGQDIPADQAVAEVMSLLGQAQGTGAAVPEQAAVTTNPHAGKAVIPTIPGQRGSVSPVKKIYKSLDDIKKRAQEVARQA